jgi:hypothetical protein
MFGNQKSLAWVGLLVCVFLSLSANDLRAQRNRLFFEDFEGLTLGDSVDEVNFGEGVWTNEPPVGWSIRNDIPEIDTEGIGVTEWKGWAFTDWEWWMTAAEDQRRSEFLEGEGGTIAVADPDEWDDLGDPDAYGLYNTWLKTPPISLAGVQANTLELNFDSSWRPEAFDDHEEFDNNQTAQITASYDGGAAVEVMLWDSDSSSDVYHDHLPDEDVSISINNPAGAQNVVLEFGLLLAENDWWWAIDNIELTGIGGGATLGDFDNNGALDAADINALSAAVRAGNNPAQYDVNGDNMVNDTDRSVWVNDLKKTYFGDANLDLEFNSSDFVAVFTVGKYETGAAADWQEGDWNGDGQFNSGDFVAAFTQGGYEKGPRPAVSVPEPSAVALLGLALIGVLGYRRLG